MSAQRWRVALDGYLVPVGGGREREVYDEGDEVVLAADYERDVAAAEVRGWNAAVRQLVGEGCTWADGDCPNGTDCLSCENLDALITERAKGDVEGWNAALEAALEYGLGNQEQSAIAALRKDTGRVKRWTCSECGATGTADSSAQARQDYAEHCGQHHNDVGF